jgi:Protein of unknown function (DUF2785)
MRRFAAGLTLVVAISAPASAQPASTRTRDEWIALAKSGFALPEGASAIDLLMELNPMLASTDPVLRDDVAFSAAERWIVHDGRVTPAELRQLQQLWTRSLDDGLGKTGADSVFKRSFSMLSLSLIAQRELAAPFLEPAEVEAFFDLALKYFREERDLRGFDEARGWMHTIAHTSDTLKFLVRNSKLPGRRASELLGAVRAKVESADTVFTWGENDRMALALQSAVRRDDADATALEEWVAGWVDQYGTLWAKGPQVDPRRFAVVENARQIMRSLVTALSVDAKPTSAGDTARRVTLAGLAKMR